MRPRACRGEAWLCFSLPPRALESSTKRVITVRERERAPRKQTRDRGGKRGERKIRSQAHGYTALLVNTMLRKHHGAVQRGHDVSIPELSSREASLEGPRGTRRSLSLSFLSPRPPGLHASFLSSLSPSFYRAVLRPIVLQPPFARPWQDVRERGTTHRASQITPLSKSPDLPASVYTVRRNHHRPSAERRLPSFLSLVPFILIFSLSRASLVESSVRSTSAVAALLLAPCLGLLRVLPFVPS